MKKLEFFDFEKVKNFIQIYFEKKKSEFETEITFYFHFDKSKLSHIFNTQFRYHFKYVFKI